MIKPGKFADRPDKRQRGESEADATVTREIIKTSETRWFSSQCPAFNLLAYLIMNMNGKK